MLLKTPLLSEVTDIRGASFFRNKNYMSSNLKVYCLNVKLIKHIEIKLDNTLFATRNKMYPIEEKLNLELFANL